MTDTNQGNALFMFELFLVEADNNVADITLVDNDGNIEKREMVIESEVGDNNFTLVGSEKELRFKKKAIVALSSTDNGDALEIHYDLNPECGYTKMIISSLKLRKKPGLFTRLIRRLRSLFSSSEDVIF